MSTWVIVLIFVVVLGLIIGNIMLLKQSANQKLPTPKKNNNAKWDEEDN